MNSEETVLNNQNQTEKQNESVGGMYHRDLKVRSSSGDINDFQCYTFSPLEFHSRNVKTFTPRIRFCLNILGDSGEFFTRN